MRPEVSWRTELYYSVGRAIARHRLERNITNRAAAEAFGIGNGSLSKIEEGTTPPPLHVVYSAARLFGVSMSDLVPMASASSSAK